MRNKVFTLLIVFSCALLVAGCIPDNGGENDDNFGDNSGDNSGGTTTLAAFSPEHFFIGNNDATIGSEASQLWITDGTEDGTRMVRDINPGNNDDISELTLVDGTLFFVADDGEGPQIWKSDGTEAGTEMVRSFELAADTRPTDLTAFKGDLFFMIAHATEGGGLWKSDGTEAGTELVKNLWQAGSFTAVGETLFFIGDDGDHGVELWSSDGSEAGTKMVRDIWEGATSGLLAVKLTIIGDMVYFTAADSEGDRRRQLWKSDGTEAGTQMVKDFGSSVISITGVGDIVYFYVNGDLWKSDGTDGGTSVVLEGEDMDFTDAIYSGGGGVAFGDKMLFAARDNSTEDGHRIWITDGTTTNSLPVDFKLEVGKFVGNRVVVGDTLYFLNEAESSVANVLWKTNGTLEGTEEIALLGNMGIDDPQLQVAGDGETLLVAGRDMLTRIELWRSNGTAAGTQMIADVCPEACDGFLGH